MGTSHSPSSCSSYSSVCTRVQSSMCDPIPMSSRVLGLSDLTGSHGTWLELLQWSHQTSTTTISIINNKVIMCICILTDIIYVTVILTGISRRNRAISIFSCPSHSPVSPPCLCHILDSIPEMSISLCLFLIPTGRERRLSKKYVVRGRAGCTADMSKQEEQCLNSTKCLSHSNS